MCQGLSGFCGRALHCVVSISTLWWAVILNSIAHILNHFQSALAMLSMPIFASCHHSRSPQLGNSNSGYLCSVFCGLCHFSLGGEQFGLINKSRHLKKISFLSLIVSPGSSLGSSFNICGLKPSLGVHLPLYYMATDGMRTGGSIKGMQWCPWVATILLM